MRIAAYLTGDEATFYLDTSGEPLFKRGWRRDTDEAPLRENLAAGLIALTGWSPGTPFLDPMCGSGTLAIEAAQIAAQRAPGLAAHVRLPEARVVRRAHVAARAPEGGATVRWPPRAATRRRSSRATSRAGAVAKAQSNARAAKVERFVAIETADVLTRGAPAAAGILLSNPPYGVRIADLDRLAEFYPRLGDALKQRFAGWTAWLFTGDLRLAKLVHLRVERRIPLYNGAIECRLFCIPLVAGRHGRPPAPG